MEDWQERARCKDLSIEESDKLFFLKRGGSPKKAQEFCAKCPVIEECRVDSILYGERGIWAGMTDEMRQTVTSFVKPLLLQQAIRDRTLKVYYQPTARLDSLPSSIRCLHCGATHDGNCPNTLPPTRDWLQTADCTDDSLLPETDSDSQYTELPRQPLDGLLQTG